MADGFDLPGMTNNRVDIILAKIDPTGHHEEELRRLVEAVVNSYSSGRPELIEAYASSNAARTRVREVMRVLREEGAVISERSVRRLKPYSERVGRWHTQQWRARVIGGLDIDPSPLMRSETIEPALREALEQGADLIRDVNIQTADQIANEVFEAFENGEGRIGLQERLKGRIDVSRSRAKLIARDQLGKLTGNLDRLRHTEAGIIEYDWLTVRDRRVRKEHAARQGRRFKWDQPPSDGHPGEAVNCRCRARAVIPS